MHSGVRTPHMRRLLSAVLCAACLLTVLSPAAGAVPAGSPESAAEEAEEPGVSAGPENELTAAAAAEVKYQKSTEGDVWKEGTLEEAVTYIASNTGTVKVLTDITLAKAVEIKGSVTIVPDDGKTVTISRGFATGTYPSGTRPGDSLFSLASVAKTLTIGDSSSGTLTIDGKKEQYQDCAGPLVYVNGTANSKTTLVLGENLVLQNNSTTDCGGGLSVQGYTNLTIKGTKIKDCESEKQGGGLYLKNSNVYTSANQMTSKIEDAEFSGNSAGTEGGGIYSFTPGTKNLIKGTKFVNNSAQIGSAVYVGDMASLTERNSPHKPVSEAQVFDGCTFQGNEYNGVAPSVTTMPQMTYKVSSTVFVSDKPDAYQDDTLAFKNATVFSNETAADLTLDLYNWGTAAGDPVVKLEDSFSTEKAKVMAGAYGASGTVGVDIFKCTDSSKAAEFQKMFVHADDVYGKCRKGAAVQFVANPDAGGGIMLSEAKFRITVEAGPNGTVTTEPGEGTDVSAETKVTVTVEPQDGYRLKDGSLKVELEDGSTVDITEAWGEDGKYEFTMPAGNVTVKAEFEPAGHNVELKETDGQEAWGDASVSPQDGPLAQGTEVTVTVTPAEGYAVSSVDVQKKSGGSVDIQPAVDGEGTGPYTGTFQMPDDDVTVTVSYRKIQYRITAEQTAGGTVTPAQETGGIGDEITVNAAADQDWTLTDVKAEKDPGGGSIDVQKQDDGSWKFTMPASDVKVTAEFTQNVYHVELPQDPQHGSVSADKTDAPAGDQITVTVEPEEGYRADVKVSDPSGGPIEAESTEDGKWQFDMPSGGAKVNVTFELIPYTITVKILPEGGGTVTPDQQTAGKGTLITLTVLPADEYELVSVAAQKEGGGDIPVDPEARTFTMPAANVTVTAQFAVKKYPVTLPDPGSLEHGSVSSDSETAAKDEKVTLTVTPEEGYQPGSVDVKDSDGRPVDVTEGPDGTYTFDMPSGGATVDVEFEAILYTVTVIQTTGGTVTASQESAAVGTLITLTVQPLPEYTFVSIKAQEEDGTDIPVDPDQHTFTMPASNVTVTPQFSQNTYAVELPENPEHGSVTSDRQEAPAGDRVTVTVEPEEGYRADVTVTDEDGSPVEAEDDGSGHWSFDMPPGGVHVDVTFEAILYTVTVREAEGGTVAASADSAPKGTEISLTVSLDAEYDFVKVTVQDEGGHDVPVAEGTNKFTMPAANVTVTGVFARKTWPVNVPEAGTAPGGSVQADRKSAAAGEKVEFTVTPDDGFRTGKVEVTDKNGQPVEFEDLGDGRYSFKMPSGGADVKAEFVQLYSIDIQASEGGTASASPDRAAEGDTVKLETVPDAEFELESTEVTDADGNSIPLNEDGTFTMPGSDVHVTVKFAQKKYDVNMPEDLKHASASADKDRAAAGEDVTVTVTPDSGWKTGSVTVTDSEGNSVDVQDNGDGTWTFKMPPGGADVSVSIESRGSSGSSGGSSGSSSRVTVNTPESDNGSYKASNRRARPGQNVTVDTDPDDGYTVGSVTVTDKNGNDVDVKDNGDGTYTFTMPKNPSLPVTVHVVFAKEGGEQEPGSGFCPSEPYLDVDQTLWYHESVDFVIWYKYMIGTAGNIFEPDSGLTRAMTVQMLWNLEGQPEAASGAETEPFPDVSQDAWYSRAIAWGASEGVIFGYDTGLFGPDDLVTREQFACMLFRYSRVRDVLQDRPADDLSGFDDSSSVSGWALDGVRWAVGNALVLGDSGQFLMPGRDASRAEAAALLMRFAKVIFPDKADVSFD